MKKSSTIFIALVVLISFVVPFNNLHAAEPTFRVLAVSGKVSVQKSPTGSWEVVKPSEEFPASAQIKVEAKSYISMFGSDATPLEYRKPGTYKIGDNSNLAANDGKGNMMQKIGKFLSDASQSPVQGRYMGAVTRAITDKASVVFPVNTKVIDPTVTLVWHSEGANTVFSVTISDGNEIVFQKETSDTTLKLSLDKDIPNIKRGQCYSWNVALKNNATSRSAPFCINWMDQESTAKLKDEYKNFTKQLTGELNPEESPLGAAIVATWYEQRGFYAEALKYYKKAGDENEVYNKLLQKFWAKMGMMLEAR